ncbi:hypothetical protein MIB92_05590 [Aestuariirhabdus sp. Z084]|uniref:hypothetical protein n=1 Tax=Aestuariirhabdus haliotis TaxID=2918751 RepID=UPI00201B4154|nr:hypothetical protein [Aestuariirhabdus haliotis]MCL6415115.1 hypothetical protein [Aestuariirhabdus haliotis]MCL6419047.1 hypothetical protein [Aestuariirhabdus haliotis]
MEIIFKDLKSIYPNAYSLLNFSPAEGLEDFRSLELPEDYYSLYTLISHENEKSDGVFGLYRLLPACRSDAVIDPGSLKSYKLGKTAQVFIPIFQSPGRQQLGYAKIDNSWVFCELDLGVEPIIQASLEEYLNNFHQKVKSEGYLEEDDLLGLIDEDDM